MGSDPQKANASMRELDKLIFGQRTQKFSGPEMASLLSSNSFTLKVFYFVLAMKMKLIDKNLYIYEVIKYASSRNHINEGRTNKEDLVLFGLALRGIDRANPNGSFILSGYGVIHILAFVVIQFL